MTAALHPRSSSFLPPAPARQGLAVVAATALGPPGFSLRRRRVLAGLACSLGLPALAAGPRLQMPPLALSDRTLANGLRVIGLPDADSGTVSVQVWYRVGSKDDPAGRSGFAHLFEHMMFKRTKHLDSEAFDRLTEDVGGRNNAFTAEDVTAYHSDVPANHLERLLWAEAERMSSLQVDQANFDSERAVVTEEYRERVLASPYGRFFNALPAAAFQVHPYKRPGIGNIDDLKAATLEDVRAFHDTYYRPDNAVLIVAGGFEPAAFERAVDRYFGALARPQKPIPRVDVVEPPRREDERLAATGPNVPLPAVALVWKAPPARHPDVPALEVAAALLSSGESSRLNQALVYRARGAAQAGFNADFHADAGMLVAYAIAAGGKPLAALAPALLREIARLAEGPIAAAELDKVRTQLLTAALRERETPDGKATAVGWGVVLHDDPHYPERELALLQAVRAADVQRVLKRHVLSARHALLSYTQEGRS